MRIAFLMHIRDCTNQLLEDSLHDSLWQSLLGLLLDVVVNACTRAQLHEEMHLRPLVDYFVQFHNVWVPQV